MLLAVIPIPGLSMFESAWLEVVDLLSNAGSYGGNRNR